MGLRFYGVEGLEGDTTTSYSDLSATRLPWICLPAYFGDKTEKTPAALKVTCVASLLLTDSPETPNPLNKGIYLKL